MRLRSSAFAFGDFAAALRATGFLAGVFFLSDLATVFLTAADFVRVERTGVLGASVLLLGLGRSDVQDRTNPERATLDL